MSQCSLLQQSVSEGMELVKAAEALKRRENSGMRNESRPGHQQGAGPRPRGGGANPSWWASGVVTELEGKS